MPWPVLAHPQNAEDENILVDDLIDDQMSLERPDADRGLNLRPLHRSVGTGGKKEENVVHPLEIPLRLGRTEFEGAILVDADEVSIRVRRCSKHDRASSRP